MSMKTGSGPYEFASNTKVVIQCEDKASVFEVDANGEPAKFVVSGRNRLQFRVKDAFAGFVAVPEGTLWSIDVQDLPSPFDKADPLPVEIPEEMQKELTLEDKLKEFVAEMVAERYGRQSHEFETLEESLDFDEDDDGLPLSGYEVTDMEPVEPDEAPPEPPAEPPKPEKPEDPQLPAE